MQKKIIGITGSIGTGKTTVCDILKKLKYNVIETDKISHELANDPKILEKIKKTFPNDKVVINSVLDRKKLRKIIFDDHKKKDKLNLIMHGDIWSKVLIKISKIDSSIIFVDVPLLYETHLENKFYKIIVVHTNFETQINRIISRDKISYNLAEKIINSQMLLTTKIKMADYVIENKDINIKKLEINLNKILNKLEK